MAEFPCLINTVQLQNAAEILYAEAEFFRHFKICTFRILSKVLRVAKCPFKKLT